MAVQLEGSRSDKRVFVGQIIETDPKTEEFKVSFLKKAPHRHESLYLWPENREESWEPMSSIKRKLGQPTVSKKSTNRRVLFSFNEV